VVRELSSNFVFRVKVGEYEVEDCGAREEVLKTVRELPGLMVDVQKGFENLRAKTTATLTVKTAAAKEEAPMQKYPKIPRTENCVEAILRILETDWGKWRPRTLAELKEALKANNLRYPGRTLAGNLLGLVKKGTVRRWRTDEDYVYILAEKEVLA
jgi:hypothetical protein